MRQPSPSKNAKRKTPPKKTSPPKTKTHAEETKKDNFRSITPTRLLGDRTNVTQIPPSFSDEELIAFRVRALNERFQVYLKSRGLTELTVERIDDFVHLLNNYIKA